MAKQLFYKEVIGSLLRDSGGLAFEKYNGDLALGNIDVPDSITRNIADADIITDRAGLAIWNYGFTSMNNLITRIDIKYKKVMPESDRWGGIKFCTRFNGADIQKHNFLEEGSTYSNHLQKAFDVLGEERALSIDAPHVRDEATVEALAKLIILWRFKPLALVDLHCKYSVIDIEMLDKIGITATVVTGENAGSGINTEPELWSLMGWPDGATLPVGSGSIDLNAQYVMAGLPNITSATVYSNDFLYDRSWMVVGRRLIPNIKKNGKIILRLMEIGGSNIDDSLVWVDTFASGDQKVDGSTGSLIAEEKT